MRVILRISGVRARELGEKTKSDVRVWRKELDALGYPVAKMVKYAKWRFAFRNYRPHVVEDIISEYDVPYSVANQVSFMAMVELGL